MTGTSHRTSIKSQNQEYRIVQASSICLYTVCLKQEMMKNVKNWLFKELWLMSALVFHIFGDGDKNIYVHNAYCIRLPTCMLLIKPRVIFCLQKSNFPLYFKLLFENFKSSYRNSQKHESTLLHWYLLKDFLTAERLCTTKYLKKTSYRSW